MIARVSVLMAMLIASPALASGASVKIPEPGDAALFILAVVGLLIGRQASRRRPGPRDPD